MNNMAGDIFLGSSKKKNSLVLYVLNTACLKYSTGKTIHTAPVHFDLQKDSKDGREESIHLPSWAETYLNPYPSKKLKLTAFC